MKVRVAGLRRSDFVRVHSRMAVSQRGNWFGAGILAVLLFLLSILMYEHALTACLIAVCAAVAAAGGLVCVAAALLVQLVPIAVVAKPAGLLEPYTVTLREDGIQTESDWGEGLLKWVAVAFLRRTGNHLLIGVTPYAVRIVPVRMFDSLEASEAFWARACDPWRAAPRNS